MSWLPLLLADPSPCLRQLVLTELLGRPENDHEVIELAELRQRDPLVTRLLALQNDEGAWSSLEGGFRAGPIKATALALARLGYLGFDPSYPPVQRGAAYLFTQQADDGAWSLSSGGTVEEEGYSMIPLQTAIPLWGLAAAGYAQDPRAERAYAWLLAQRLEDGAWPTGVASDVYGRVAGYRRLAHSRWGCRSNTTGALTCLALHPERRQGPEARRALDLLLGQPAMERRSLGYGISRLLGAESPRGFITFYARHDGAHLLDLCWRVGATTIDVRVADLVAFVEKLGGPYGLWPYAAKPQVSRWLTFDLLRSLSRLDAAGDWLSLEPRTPFQAYPRHDPRY